MVRGAGAQTTHHRLMAGKALRGLLIGGFANCVRQGAEDLPQEAHQKGVQSPPALRPTSSVVGSMAKTKYKVSRSTCTSRFIDRKPEARDEERFPQGCPAGTGDNCRDQTPNFSTPCLSQQSSSQRKGMSWPSKGRPAFHKCPAPQPFPEKNHPLKKTHVAAEISAVTGPDRAKPRPPRVSSPMPRPCSQRQSELTGPHLGLMCHQ